jgi:hypothetical protein
MSTFEELESAIPISEAATYILDLAEGSSETFPGGMFYRFGENIPF